MTKATYKELTAKASEVMEQSYYMRNDLHDLGNDLELDAKTREALIVTLNQLVFEAQELAKSLIACRD